MDQLPPPGWKNAYYTHYDLGNVLDDGPFPTRDEAIAVGVIKCDDEDHGRFWIEENFLRLSEGEGFVLDANGEKIYVGSRIQHAEGTTYHHFWVEEVFAEQDPQKMVVKDYWGRHVNATDFVVADRLEDEVEP